MNGRSLGRSALLTWTLLTAMGLAVGAALASGGLSTGGGANGGGDNGGTFPVRGKHIYGDGIGAGRGHQGQDILADCGKRVVAAEAGRVRYVDYQASGAGHYVVVKGKGKTYDYVYMHMLKRLSVREGERLRAGEQIGRVGSTGRSTACHLHFEMWRAPGWYRGGRLEDPRPFLKRWDRNQ